MSRLRFVLRLTTYLAPVSTLILGVYGVANAVPIVINNGSAPPNAANVIDVADDYSDDSVYVRNVGCQPGWPAVFPHDLCPSPGAPTEVEIVTGGEARYLLAYDSSTIEITGGTVA